MTSADRDPARLVFVIDHLGGLRYVIYNASDLVDPADHLPDKWYCLPYPVPLGSEPAGPFETAEEAEASTRQRLSMPRRPASMA